jgi:hypothetical protein
MKRKFFIVLIFSVIGVFIIWLIGFNYPTHLYSPNDLVREHQGPCVCKSCHIPFKGISSALCQTSDCHPAERLLSYSVASINELHKWVLGEDGCLECHTEHEGIDGKITSPFNHTMLPVSIVDECISCHDADYQQAHRDTYGIVCKQCHTSEKDWKVIHFNHGVFAEGKMCTECHPIPQEGLHIYYGQNCERCHTIERWKPATLDHTMVARVDCVTCHAKERDKAHPGKYSDLCETCHGTIDWEVLYFDHEGLMAGERCVGCHNKPEDSLHYGASSECETCHSTKKWKPALFEHINFFPLTDEHRVSCDTCHETADYKTYTCTNCHIHDTRKIRHEHEEHGIFDYARCLDCHRVTLYDRAYGTPRVHEGFEEEEEHHYKRRREREYDDDD